MTAAKAKATEGTEGTEGTDTAEVLPKDIGSIIPRIRAELGVIAKEDEPEFGTKFKYRGHDQIVNAIVPLLNKYGVFITVEDELLRYEGRPAANNKWNTAGLIRKAVTFHAPDGSTVTSTVVAESTDNGNKAVSQAQTYAYRYALTQTFTIPTGEADPDSNNEDAPGAAEPVRTAVQSAPAPSEDEIKALKVAIAESYAAIGVPKEQIAERGKAFFNGREGWDTNKAALNKLLKAIQSGDEAAIGK